MTHFIFDCDDVLLNWQSAFALYLGNRGINLRIDGPAEWCMSNWIGCTPVAAKSWVTRFNASPAFGHMALMPEAYETLWALHDAGHTIEILTACGDACATRQARQANLDRVFQRDGALPYSRVTCLPLGESKFDFLWNATRNRDPRKVAFVDDNYAHAKSGAMVGVTSYCTRRSHNRQQEADNPMSDVLWIDDIREIAQRHVMTGVK